MSSFDEKVEEINLNFDTISMMKEDLNIQEIKEIFKSEIEYPIDLTDSLVNLNKINFKSCIIRLKFIKDKDNCDLLIDKLIKCNKNFKSLTDYLLDSDENEDEADEVDEVDEVDEADEADEADEEDEADEADEMKSDEEILDNFLGTKIERCESEESEVSILDAYNKYCEYCETEHHVDNQLDTSTFKKYIKSKYGKPEGKGENAKFKYLNFV